MPRATLVTVDMTLRHTKTPANLADLRYDLAHGVPAPDRSPSEVGHHPTCRLQPLARSLRCRGRSQTGRSRPVHGISSVAEGSEHALRTSVLVELAPAHFVGKVNWMGGGASRAAARWFPARAIEASVPREQEPSVRANSLREPFGLWAPPSPPKPLLNTLSRFEAPRGRFATEVGACYQRVVAARVLVCASRSLHSVSYRMRSVVPCWATRLRARMVLGASGGRCGRRWHESGARGSGGR